MWSFELRFSAVVVGVELCLACRMVETAVGKVQLRPLGPRLVQHPAAPTSVRNDWLTVST